MFANKLDRLYSMKEKGGKKSSHETVKRQSENERRHDLRSHTKAPLS
jgi:hypothetical protein